MIAEARSPPLSKVGLPAWDHLSYSAVSLYQSCSLRFAFHYVLDLPERVVSASLVTGSGLHHALDLHFRELMMGQPAPSLDVLLDAFWEKWHDFEDVEVRLGKGETIDDIGKLAERVLRAFRLSDLAHPKGTIIGIEEPLRGALVPGVPDLVGRIDLMVEDADGVTITDFKTARSAWSQDHAEDAAGQLLLYHQLAGAIAGDKPISLQFMVLTKTKVPDIVVHPVAADPKQIARTKAIVERAWRGIAAGIFIPSPSPTNCPGCPYRSACRAWTG